MTLLLFLHDNCQLSCCQSWDLHRSCAKSMSSVRFQGFKFLLSLGNTCIVPTLLGERGCQKNVLVRLLITLLPAIRLAA